jgi:nucleoside-diphosphate-sugar epimerase
VGDPAAVHALLHALRPRVIIHTAYRKAGPELERVTAAGAGHVAQAAAQIGARLIHVSSDVLLDGEHAPYDESAQPASLHPYGQAKAEAERLVQAGRAGRGHGAHLADLPVGSARPDQRLGSSTACATAGRSPSSPTRYARRCGCRTWPRR